MGGLVAGILAGVLGGVIAVGASVGLVASQTVTPAPVTKAFIVYGSN